MIEQEQPKKSKKRSILARIVAERLAAVEALLRTDNSSTEQEIREWRLVSEETMEEYYPNHKRHTLRQLLTNARAELGITNSRVKGRRKNIKN